MSRMMEEKSVTARLIYEEMKTQANSREQGDNSIHTIGRAGKQPINVRQPSIVRP